MSIEKRKKIYNMVSKNLNEKNLRKIRAKNKKNNYCRYEEELLKLIKTIPNWETYLTKKQYIITKLFISYRNTTAIDIQLKLTEGVSWHALFGSQSKNKKMEGGVLKKLRYVKDILDQKKK